MSTIILGGSISSALTHFALYGLADIVEVRFGQGLTLGWTEEQEPRAWIEAPNAEQHDIAAAVLDAASLEHRQWPRIRHTYSNKATLSPFSPRIKAIDTDKHPADWDRHQNIRWEVLDELMKKGDTAELRFLAALGEPSYWHITNDTRQPDRGASRWEMKTRNRGEEFVSHRYEPLCRELHSWPVEHVLEGLTGRQVRDPLGKGKTDSRSSTGFTRPAPTDNALTFCALRGITNFPIVHLISKINATPGAWPSTVLHPRSMILPVPIRGVTPSRVRSVILSKQLHDVHQSLADPSAGVNATASDERISPLAIDAAQKWLAARRIPAVMNFPILKTGSSSAPERQILDGEVHLNDF